MSIAIYRTYAIFCDASLVEGASTAGCSKIDNLDDAATKQEAETQAREQGWTVKRRPRAAGSDFWSCPQCTAAPIDPKGTV